MKLVIINGSPRYKNSNSEVLIRHFSEGYLKVSSEKELPVFYLAGKKQRETIDTVFRKADMIIFVFPLYTDSMPGIVKEALERIACNTCAFRKKLGFIVQSGFPEAVHSVFTERYLEKYAKRIECVYLGTVIKGGMEGIKMMPPRMTKKLFDRFNSLGQYVALHDSFSPEITADLRKKYVMPPIGRFFFKLASIPGWTNYYWNMHLKKNGAYENRNDRPYRPKT